MDRVVIVGGGYGGTEVIRQLVLRGVRNVEVELISVRGSFENTIAGTEIISDKLKAESLRYDLKELSTYWGFGLTVGRVEGIDLDTRIVKLSNGEKEYDILVLAAGSTPNFFDVKGTELALQSYWLSTFEVINRQLKQLSPSSPKVVVVGAGYVGLEVAAEALDLFKTMNKEGRIVVIEKMGSVLPGFGNELARKVALETLSARGIGFVFGKGVRQIEEGRVILEDGSEIANDMIIWSGGIKSSNLSSQISGAPLYKGYVDVDERLLVRGRRDAFAIGDMASVRIGDQVAQKMAGEALEQGATVAKNILSMVRGEGPKVTHTISYPTDNPRVLLSLGEGKALLISGPKYASAGSSEYFLKRRIDVDEMMGRFPG